MSVRTPVVITQLPNFLLRLQTYGSPDPANNHVRFPENPKENGTTLCRLCWTPKLLTPTFFLKTLRLRFTIRYTRPYRVWPWSLGVKSVP